MSDFSHRKDAFARELKTLAKTLAAAGFVLDAEQPHLSGERYLMMKEKLVLVGVRERDNLRTIIKVSKEPRGREEIRKEKRIRDLLSSVSFTTDTLLFPNEMLFGEYEGYLVWASEYIPQQGVFPAYPIETQFFLLLKAFEMQEAFHATTAEHLRAVMGELDIMEGPAYIERFASFHHDVEATVPGHPAGRALARAHELLRAQEPLIDANARYLTHTDFVPGNFRVHEHQVYLLDLSSVLFGNRYEGLARFQNYAIIHDPDLAPLIEAYIAQNRGESHARCLRLMRLYKMGFLISYYVRSLSRTTGNLRLLTEKRLDLWRILIESLLEEQPTPSRVIDQYRAQRNALRSPEEVERQKEFNIPEL